MTIDEELAPVLAEVRACRVCVEHLPLGPRPVVRISPTAPLLLIGQAPGTKVHESGIPWDDPSGDRLRDWLGLDRDAFYDESRIAIMPMGFCYPGVEEKGGDKPPRKECAPLWHDRLRALMPGVRLTLLIGLHAQRHYLGPRAGRTMTDTVRDWQRFLPDYLPLPHPSWRSTGWLRKNLWFEEEIVPYLRALTRRM